YGGSSLIVCCAAIGLLMRIHYETNGVSRQASKGGARKATRTAGRIKKKPATGVRAGGALL
ncbi:MAG: FtsW/RodA/SpoVE family cell cycle protein, partial [Gammaproteobacteria bacterium]|nr:FtsW/RodA/SpoVE family cell cycle protein [Gammaproteobacteria bacterium]